ncbi:MAG: DUF1302 domain-containing protein, partial [Nevskia sp.]|nr:DUF1302 domain-containing protein [Nevskia sp.]
MTDRHDRLSALQVRPPKSGTDRLLAVFALASLLGVSGNAHALSESFNVGGDELKMVLNNTFTVGGGIRMQSPNVELIGKSNLDRNVCGVPYQSCQGVFKDQIFPAQKLARSPGAAAVNGDDGDLNYSKYHFFQAPAKLTSDLTLSYKEFGVFARLLYFYDFVNNDFTETHPNRITAQNRDDPNVGVSPLTPLLLPYPGGKVYGPGARVRSKRSDGEVLRQIGTDLQYLDSYFYGKLPIPFTDGKSLSFKLGRQLVNWGESTTLVLNSLNQANPINANNFYRIGNQVEEDFVPINMVDLSFEPFENATMEGFYQLEWKPVEAPAPGSYFSDADLGTNNAGRTAAISFAGGAEDPDSVAALQYNPLALLTNTTLTAQRLPDREPRTSGQYGLKLDYYADWLNNGTELAAYYMHYHSRLPYVSFYSANASCARAAGNPRHDDATDLASFLLDCPDLPLLHPFDPARATSSVEAIDSVRLLLEYPQDIDLIGVSFNTTLGNYSIQGEVAYRPNLPLQVDEQDLAFAALGPTLTSCSDPKVGCAGTAGLAPGLLSSGVGFDENGNRVGYGRSDFTDASGRVPYSDTINVIEGALPGAARSFPNFIIPYRGGVVGENPPNSYIRGYERFQVYQFNLGATRVLGATDNPFGADQILIVGEFGATFVPQLPPLDVLQLEAPNTNYAASAGADGSGANGSRQACSTTPDCTYGPDGLRFNPHQQDPTGYPDKLSWGYRLIGIFKYENVLPGVGLQPTLYYAQDVQGTAPGPGGNFVAGRKQVNTLVETRYKSALSFSLGYTWFWGGGAYNTLSDRDFAQF